MFDHKGNPIGDHHQTLFPHAATLRDFQRIHSQNATQNAARTAALNTVPKPHTPKPKPHTGRKTLKTEDETRQFHHHSPYETT
jgi:hypothetical protein